MGMPGVALSLPPAIPGETLYDVQRGYCVGFPYPFAHFCCPPARRHGRHCLPVSINLPSRSGDFQCHGCHSNRTRGKSSATACTNKCTKPLWMILPVFPWPTPVGNGGKGGKKPSIGLCRMHTDRIRGGRVAQAVSWPLPGPNLRYVRVATVCAREEARQVRRIDTLLWNLKAHQRQDPPAAELPTLTEQWAGICRAGGYAFLIGSLGPSTSCTSHSTVRALIGSATFWSTCALSRRSIEPAFFVNTLSKMRQLDQLVDFRC